MKLYWRLKGILDGWEFRLEQIREANHNSGEDRKMKKQIFLSTAYFVATFSVYYIFNLIYKILFSIKWYTPSTLIQTIQIAGLITVMLTYGDYRENKVIHSIINQADTPMSGGEEKDE